MISPLLMGVLLFALVIGRGNEPQNQVSLGSTALRGILAMLITFALYRAEGLTTPSFQTHARQCAVVYVGAILGVLMGYEGLTVRTGHALLVTALTLIIANAVVLLLLRARTRGAPRLT